VVALGVCLSLVDVAVPTEASSILEGLVGYWPCDEGQGDRAANLMGASGDLFGSTGDATAPGLQWAPGRFGRAIRLAGKGATVQQMEALHIADAVTVSAWVKLDEVRANALIFTREAGYRLGLDPSGKGRVRWQLNAGGKWAGNWLLGKTVLQAGRWYNITAVYDGQERRIYVNGQLDARMPTTGMIALGDHMMIGQNFSGLIDELRVWNRALSPEEITRAMAVGAAQVRALLCPVDSLRCYPVKCVGMQGTPECAEVAVFNSASAPYQDNVSVAIVSAAGKPLAHGNRQLAVSPRGIARIRVPYKAIEPGMGTLTVNIRGRELCRLPVYVMAPHPRRAPGELKLEKVVSVDLSQNLGPEEICQDAACKVVDSPLGHYREAGSRRDSRFVARLTLPRLGLYLVRVSYPDDKVRTCEVAMVSPSEADLYNVQTGYLTGAEYPCTNRMQTLECFLWPRDVHQAVLLTTKTDGQPAAAASIEAFEVTGGLPSSPAATSAGARQIGLYYEDANPFPACLGQQGTGIAEFDHAMCNLCDLMDYTGENVLCHPGVWYDGPIYNSLVEQSGTDGGHDFPHGTWIDILLKRFEERRFKFYPTLNVHRLPSLETAAIADPQKVKEGQPTFNAVQRDGTVAARTYHGRLPAYNAIHPEVERRVLAIVQDMADRFGASPAFGGVAFHMTRCTLLQLGGIDAGYDDWSIAQFEKDTATTIPVEAKDPDRFGKRYTWLMANARDAWIGWRCRQMADYFGRVARILTGKRADLRLVAVILNPHVPVPSDLQQWQAGKRHVELSREAGLDPALLAQQPGVMVERSVGPSDYRWYLSHHPRAAQSLLAVRKWYFTDDQLRDYRRTKELGVWFYYRYFESAAPKNPLSCAWYRDPGWLATAIAPGGDYYLEDYAHTMAVLDPTVMVNGGFTLGIQGHCAQLERFAQIFRLLPVGDWKDVTGLSDQVAARTLEVGGQHYLYIVNRSSSKANVTIPPAAIAQGMKPLGQSPVLNADGKVSLGPFELVGWSSAL
jgi:hypothetical protein